MLDKVTRDQEFAPLMEDWNAFVDAAWDYKGRQNSTTIGKGGTPRFDLVPVRNDESDTLAAFSGVMFRNMAFKVEEDGRPLLGGVAPVFSVKKPTADDKDTAPFGVLVEPVEAGKMGRAIVAGVTLARIRVENETHGYAAPYAEKKQTGSGPDDPAAPTLKSSLAGSAQILWKAGGTGKKWCVLLLGGGGGGGQEYAGGFKLSLAVDRSDPDNVKRTLTVAAGFARVNGKDYAVSGQEFEVAASGCVMLTCEQEGTPVLSWNGSRTTGSEKKAERLIGRVVKLDEDNFQVIQEQHGDVEVTLYRTCKDDGSGEEGGDGGGQS